MRKSCFFSHLYHDQLSTEVLVVFRYTHTYFLPHTLFSNRLFFYLSLLLLFHFFFIHKFMNHVFFIVPVLSYIVAAGAVILCYTHIFVLSYVLYHPHSFCANNAISWHRVHLHSSGIQHQTNCFYTLVDCSNITKVNAMCYSLVFSLSFSYSIRIHLKFSHFDFVAFKTFNAKK